jgi:signal transduction histidine kinase
MQTLVDRELKRARILSDQIVARAEAGEVIRRVVEVLRRTPGGKAIDWTIDADNEYHARIHPDDLMEAIGAILENACRFAKRQVTISVSRQGQYIEIRTRDDGPGVSTADLSTITRRGVRLDESAAGDGIGLALAAEILDAAGAQLFLENASPGLEVIVHLRAVELPA